MDLFAPRRSSHLPIYFSVERRAGKSAGFNALNQDWNFRRMYASPPPQPIPLILAKLRGCRGVLIMVTPFWTRSAWLPELLQLSMVPPLRLPDRPNTVTDLTSGNPLPSLSICSTGSEEKVQIRTWASARAVPISTIRAAADWSSVKTMARHYIRPLPQGPPLLNICQFRGRSWEIDDLRNQYFLLLS